MKRFDVIVIGGGAAGLMAAISAASYGTVCDPAEGNTGPKTRCTVCLLEKMPSCGNKIKITGKGRCNVTNMAPWNEFERKVHPRPNLFRPAFYSFPNTGLYEFLESEGLPLTVERGNRVYPASMRASDVVTTLVSTAERQGVSIMTSACVSNVTKKETGFTVTLADGRKTECRTLVMATGGLSYPATGSTGDGYAMAETLGHRTTPLFPALTALVPENYPASLQGISLKNVGVALIDSDNTVQTEFGDLDFTDGGIEGPIGFKVSRRAVKSLVNGGKVFLDLDLKPALAAEELSSRIDREISQGKYSRSTPVQSVLNGFMPHALVAPFMADHKGLDLAGIPAALKSWRFRIVSYVGYRRAVVTAGGIDMAQINQKTMESKLTDGLFFAGELLDLDADTGGYNLQIAFSTGHLAGYKAAEKALTSE